MEEIQEAKKEIRFSVTEKIGSLSREEQARKEQAIENRLFDFANFLESKIALLYLKNGVEVSTQDILKRCRDYNKIVILPVFSPENNGVTLMKVDNLDAGIRKGPGGVLEPDPAFCKVVPVDCIDIAIIPSVALDEKGGRVGSGRGGYDRFMPELSITTRKVALAFEEQIVAHVPMENHDRHVDIIITEKRIIYKI